MLAETKLRIIELCRQASEETDSGILLELVHEINQLLDGVEPQYPRRTHVHPAA